MLAGLVNFLERSLSGRQKRRSALPRTAGFNIEPFIAEVPVETSVDSVRPGLRERVHLHARGPTLRDVGQVRDYLEPRDRVAAQARLTNREGGRESLADLLPSTPSTS